MANRSPSRTRIKTAKKTPIRRSKKANATTRNPAVKIPSLIIRAPGVLEQRAN